MLLIFVPERAVAVIYNLETEQKLGVVKFNYDKKGDVVIKVELQNISAGEHGFHIHEYGDLRNHGTLTTPSKS